MIRMIALTGLLCACGSAAPDQPIEDEPAEVILVEEAPPEVAPEPAKPVIPAHVPFTNEEAKDDHVGGRKSPSKPKKFQIVSVPTEGTDDEPFDWPFEARGRPDFDGDGKADKREPSSAPKPGLIDDAEIMEEVMKAWAKRRR